MVEKFVDASDKSIWGALKQGIFTGAVLNMRNSDYHALDKYASSTRLKHIYATSPAHYKAKYLDNPQPSKQTEAMTLGSLVHCLVLTPHEYASEFFILPEINMRTNDGKAEYAALVAANAGKIAIDEELLEKARAMTKSVLSHPKAKLLDVGRKEAAFFWQCPFSGLRFKAKLDQSSSQYFVEFKTTVNASPEIFAKQAFNLNYDLSLNHYREGLRMVMDVSPPAYLIAVESSAPHVCQFYKAGDELFETGKAKWLQAVTRLESSMKTGVWSAYHAEQDEIPTLLPPAWAIKKEVLLEETNDDGGLFGD